MKEGLIEGRWREDWGVGAYCAETESLQSHSANVTHPLLSFLREGS